MKGIRDEKAANVKNAPAEDCGPSQEGIFNTPPQASPVSVIPTQTGAMLASKTRMETTSTHDVEVPNQAAYSHWAMLQGQGSASSASEPYNTTGAEFTLAIGPQNGTFHQARVGLCSTCQPYYPTTQQSIGARNHLGDAPGGYPLDAMNDWGSPQLDGNSPTNYIEEDLADLWKVLG